MSAPCKDQDEATPAVEPLCKLYSPQGGPSGIFTSKAGDYAASRPDYPAAVFGALKIYCPPQPGKWVLDVGAGTGLFTRGLLEHGYSVLASINDSVNSESGICRDSESFSALSRTRLLIVSFT